MSPTVSAEVEIPIPADDTTVGDFASLELEEIPSGERNFEADFRRC
jgi:hypothetical protein